VEQTRIPVVDRRLLPNVIRFSGTVSCWKAGKGLSYTNPDGTVVADKQVLQRIRSIVIPPAWTEVWICRYANGHIQATGRDAKGRKQYVTISPSAKFARAPSTST
jgi:DNA topoisomerase IB